MQTFFLLFVLTISFFLQVPKTLDEFQRIFEEVRASQAEFYRLVEERRKVFDKHGHEHKDVPSK